MDAATLSALISALEASPDNPQLAQVVFGHLMEADRYDRLLALAGNSGITVMSDPICAVHIAEAHRRAGDPERAAGLLTGIDMPRAHLALARALVDLQRFEEGRAEYMAAIAGNSTLEDVELARALQD